MKPRVIQRAHKILGKYPNSFHVLSLSFYYMTRWHCHGFHSSRCAWLYRHENGCCWLPALCSVSCYALRHKFQSLANIVTVLWKVVMMKMSIVNIQRLHNLNSACVSFHVRVYIIQIHCVYVQYTGIYLLA